MAEPLAGSAKGVPILKHQVIPFARQINPGIDRNDPQAAVTAIELRFPGTFSHKAWRVIRYMEGAMFLYAYKGKFIVTDESLELTAYGDGSYEKPFGAPRWAGSSLDELEGWLEQIADEYDKLAEVPGWEIEQPAERIISKAPWHEPSPNILVKLVRSNQFVGVKTYCRKHGSHGRFLINEAILRWLLEAEIGAVKFDSDCGDYVKIMRRKDSLQFSFAWLNTYGDDSVKGFRQDITIPLLTVQLVLDDGEAQKYLYIPPEPCAKIITCHAARTIREIVKDKQKRRALSKGLRDCFRWANETVTLYPDGKDSFFFTTKSGCPKNGGLILHEGVRHGCPCLYYCVHT